MLNIIETILKIAALFAGGGFFLWKVLTGWLVANLKLTVTATREPKDNETDYLAIAVILDKGITDSVWLKDVSVRVTHKGNMLLIPIEGFEHLQVDKGKIKIEWTPTDSDNRNWLLSAGETLQLGALCDVPVNIPAKVEAAVLATRLFWKPFQWRAVVISLPKARPSPDPSIIPPGVLISGSPDGTKSAGQ